MLRELEALFGVVGIIPLAGRTRGPARRGQIAEPSRFEEAGESPGHFGSARPNHG
jgi:hypothetical protein